MFRSNGGGAEREGETARTNLGESDRSDTDAVGGVAGGAPSLEVRGDVLPASGGRGDVGFGDAVGELG